MKAQNKLNIDFIGKVGIFGTASLLFVIASLVFLAVRGINYGIDFRGGTEIQVKFQQEVGINEVRTTLQKLDIGDVAVQRIGEESEFVIRFQGKAGNSDKETNENLNAAIDSVKNTVTTTFANKNPDIRRIDSVGPQVGAELKRSGLLAAFYCLLVIFIYIGLRFDYKYAPGAVICLFHDAIITLAIFVAVGKEVNIPILAAILTLIGYSMNDTIVVFDRIRETEAEGSKESLKNVINRAINDMFGRTIITSGTTFVTALCLYLFATGTVSDIAFALTVGIFFGTYSSIYVAAPLIIMTDKLKQFKSA